MFYGFYLSHTELKISLMVFKGGKRILNSKAYPNIMIFFFSCIGLLCGGILFFQGWRLDPILLLSQILLSGTTIFFIAESLYLRKNLNFVKSKKKSINLAKKNIHKYIYENFKLKKKWNELNYTRHIFYKKKKH